MYNGKWYTMCLFDSKLHIIDLYHNEYVKGPFPLGLHEIVHVCFRPEKSRLSLHCYLPLWKKHHYLELVTMDFKCSDELALVENWINHARTKLSGNSDARGILKTFFFKLITIINRISTTFRNASAAYGCH